MSKCLQSQAKNKQLSSHMRIKQGALIGWNKQPTEGFVSKLGGVTELFVRL